MKTQLTRLVILLACLGARADTVINFDDLTPPTFITAGVNQGHYVSQGINFDAGGANLGLVIADGNAPSSPNVLDISDHGSDFNLSYIRGVFVDGHHNYVQMQIGAEYGQYEGGGGQVTLTAYDLGNNIVGTSQVTVTPTSSSEGWTTLRVDAAGGNIASFVVNGSYNRYFRIDNVQFDNISPSVQPDFALNYQGSFVNVLYPLGAGPSASSTCTFKVQVTRLNGSAGNLNFQITGLPPHVTVQSLTPNPSDGTSNPENITVVLQADPAAASVANLPVTFTGCPMNSSVGAYGCHSLQFLLTVGATYDARIVNMEITQCIQSQNLPSRPIDPSTGDLQASIPYSGVDLADSDLTLVRVFAGMKTMPQANAGSQIPVISCRLYGFDHNSQPLPGSPLLVSSPIGTYPQAWCCANNVTDQQRQSADDYRFMLPASWTHGTISLQAQLVPDIQSLVPLSVDCCPNNDTFTMTGITFNLVQNISFDSTFLLVNDNAQNPPRIVMAEAIKLLPLGEHQALTPPYDNTLDITDLWNKPLSAYGDPGPVDVDRANEVAARLRGKLDDWHLLSGGVPNLTVGIFPNYDSVSTLSAQIRGLTSYSGGNELAIFPDSGRPITAVAHEIGHLLGRPHASPGCVPICSEDWAPDEVGLIQGVGFNFDTSAVLDPLAPGGTALYDLMSYCTGGNDAVSWTSPKGWEESIFTLSSGAVGTPPGAKTCTSGDVFDSVSPSGPPAPVHITDGSMLSVQGLTDGTTGKITKVGVATSVIMGYPASSLCNLIVRDINGAVLTNVPMWLTLNHADDAPTTGFVYAYVPAAGVASAEIVLNGTMVDKRMRSANTPVVQITSVQPDMPIPGTTQTATMISWMATDADNDPLMAKVDYSTDGGLNWRNLYFGPNKNGVSLSSSFFSAAPLAMVMVRISDGFNETNATSQAFAEAGAPPTVIITSPNPGTTIGNEETLHCSGDAYDDQHQMIADTNLNWYAGKKLIGTGGSISVTGLAPITQTLTLVATDYLGRTGSASVIINVRRTGISATTLPDPGLINSNLVLWLSAETQVLADSNGLVSFWGDLSGNGNNAVQANSMNQPILVPNALQLPAVQQTPGALLPAVQFGASGDQFLTIPSQVLTSPQFTIIAVVNDNGSNSNSREIFSSYGGATSGQPVSLGVAGPIPVAAQFGQEFVNHQALVHSPQLLSVLSAVAGVNSDGVNITTLYQNQRVIGTAAVPGTLMNSLAGPYAIGQLFGAVGDTFWRGNMAEILVYNAALSGTELQQVYNYLQNKYPNVPGTPKFGSTQIISNNLVFTFTTEANRPYTVQYTDTLDTRPVPWMTLASFFAMDSISTLTVTDSLAHAQRFYRLVIPAVDPPNTNPQPPVVLTLPASLITSSSATLNGSVAPNGNDSTAWYQYGLDTNYGQITASTIVAGTNPGPVAVSSPVNGLAASTTYHCQLVASNSAGLSYGGDQPFTTTAPASLPILETMAATSISSNSAVLNGTINANGSQGLGRFEYGTDTSYTGGDVGSYFTSLNNDTEPYSYTLTGLTPSTTYHYLAFGYNCCQEGFGTDATFTTAAVSAPPSPILVTMAATSITSNSAVLNGTIDANGSQAVAHFKYGTDTSYSGGQVDTYFTSANGDTEPFSYTLTGLSPGTTYHFLAFGFNCCEEGIGSDVTFTTPNPQQAPPTVTTLAASSVTSSGAVLNGSANPNGSPTTAFFEYGTTTSYGNITTQTGIGTTPQSDFQATLSGLASSTTYHYRMDANNGGGISYGADMTFTTAAPQAPTVATLAASSVTETAAVLNGSVNPNGASTTAYFEYGTTTSYGTITTQTGIGTTPQSDFQAALSGLASSTTYHYRMDANNGGGISHGSDMTFTTAWVPVAPTLVSPGASTAGQVTLSSLTPTFSWSASSLATDSSLIITKSPYGSGNVVATIDIGKLSSYALPSGYLLPGTAYSWYMISYNILGDPSAASSSLYFTTPAAPTAITQAASSISFDDAKLNGSVNPNGLSTTVYFQFGTTTGYGSTTTSTGIGSGTGAVNVGIFTGNINSGTTFHFRVVASNSLGTSYGSDMSFTTPVP